MEDISCLGPNQQARDFPAAQKGPFRYMELSLIWTVELNSVYNYE